MKSLPSPSELPVVGVLVEVRTYKHLLYLLAALPLGFVYSAVFSILALGIALSVVGIGLIILLATLLGARGAVKFERWLANQLLDTELDGYDDVAVDADGAFGGVTKYIEAASTWRGVGFLSLKFFITVFALVPVFMLASGLPLLSAPLRYPFTTRLGELNDEPVRWSIETLPESLLAVAIGVVVILVTLHVANLSAYVTRQMATALLGVRESTANEAPTSQLGD
jgi:hypothetical protein